MNNYTPIDIIEIEPDGPIIEVTIRKVGSVFAGISARGLIDTGATDIVISPDIADKLELKHVNDDLLNVVGGGTLYSKVYSGLIDVPALKFNRIVPLHVVPWKQTTHTILLGRAFLRHFIFNYDGPHGMFHFSNPIGGTHEVAENLDG
jgi:predicted aspartyl protease